MTRAPLDLGGGRPTSGAELNIARQVIVRSGVVDALRPLIDSGIGRPRHLSLLGLLVACQLNAFGRHHQAHLVEVARTLNAMTRRRRGAVSTSATGTPTRPITGSSGSLSGSVRFSSQVMPGLNEEWFANQLARAAIPRRYLVSGAVAVDGTDVETWGALHGEAVTVDLDGEATETQLVNGGPPKARREPSASSEGARHRSRRSQALHRRSRRPSRAPIGHEQPPGWSLRRLRTPPGRPGPRRAMDQPHRSDHAWAPRSPG